MVVMITDRHKSYKDDHRLLSGLSSIYCRWSDVHYISSVPSSADAQVTSNWTRNSGLVIVGFSETWSAQGKPYREGETQIIH
jgi:hypothetical protein